MPRPRRTASLLAAAAALAVLPAAAHAAAITYVDGGEVWVASLDGARRAQLTRPGELGAGQWQQVTMSDNGRVAAQRRDGASMFTQFALWGADGQLLNHSALPYENGWTLYVMPVGFDLTADGVSLVYGYSNSRGFFPNAVYETGYYAINAEQTRSLIQPLKFPGRQWPTLSGARVVATDNSDEIFVQQAGGQPPYSPDFDPWITINGGWEVNRANASADGTTVGIELKRWSAGTVTEGRILMASTPGGLGSPPVDDCFMPVDGVADDVSVSPDGALVAWKDASGIKVAGRPLFNGPADCALTSPPVVISPSGASPAIGGMNVDVLLPPVQPPGGGGGTPPGGGGGTPPGVTPPGTRTPGTGRPGSGVPGAGGGGGGASGGSARPGAAVTVKLAAPGRARAAALAAGGLRVTVTVTRAGRVTIAGSVPARALRRGARGTVVVARGSATARRAGRVTVTLRATRAARGKLGRLVGQRLALKATSGGRATAAVRLVR